MKHFTTKLAVLFCIFALFGANCLAEEVYQNAANTTNNLVIAQLSPQKYLYGIVLENQSGSGSSKRVKDGIGIAGNHNLRIINLGAAVNSTADDYAPTVTADGKTIYFVSNRQGSKLLPNGKLSSDFWAFKKSDPLDTVFTSANPYNIDESQDLDRTGINTIMNEGVATITADGKGLYITGCDRPDGYGDCDLYFVKLEGDKWGKPINLGKSVNSSDFDSQPSLAPDGSRLYFTSTRKGPNSSGNNGYDDMDIWYCDWDNDLDEWKVAKNLEIVNSSSKDCSPFICADSKSLIFASDRGGGYGGLDFYVSYYTPSSNSWSKPENLGQPLNSGDDEQFLSMPAASSQVLYFSSTRNDVSGYQGNLDLFMGMVPTYPRIILVKGNVVDECSGDAINAQVVITNKISNKKTENIYDNAKKSFSLVITDEEFGDNDSMTIEIVATHPTLGSKTVTKKIGRFEEIEDADLAGKYADSVVVTIPMGDRPSLVPVIAESEYIAKVKGTQPKLASFRGLVMEEILNWSLYPLLTYFFFDEGSSEYESRYQIFKSPNDTRNFTDTTIVGGTLNKYYHILNIFGFRLNKYPDEKIEIVGCNDAESAKEKRAGLSKERADKVFNYLKTIWNISEDRMKLTYRDIPALPSNRKDSLGMKENRRVEIISSEWEIYKPIFDKDFSKLPTPDDMVFQMSNGIEDDIVASRKIVIKHGKEDWITLTDIGTTTKTYTWDWTNEDGKYPNDNTPFTAQIFVTTKSGAVCTSDPVEIPVMQVSTEERIIATGEGKTKEDYSLILFPFGSDQAGPVNERVMRDYVYGRIFVSSDIIVTGHTDVVGLFDFNVKLSQRRANTVKNGIQKQSGGKYKSMNVSGVGPESPLYPNDIPEGRFYNRTVNVQIESTITSATGE